MDFNAMIESLMALVRHNSISVVVYACVVCLLTEVVKRLFIPKLKLDLQNKFDPTILFPFIFGCGCALFHATVVAKSGVSGSPNNWLIEGLTIGATSTVLYRMFASTFGDNLKKLQKDEVFSMFYSAIFVYTNAKNKLLDGSLDFKTLLAEVKLVSQKATDIYNCQLPADQKKQKLVVLMSGVLDDDIIYQVIDPIHNTMQKTFEQKQG